MLQKQANKGQLRTMQ